MPEQATHRLGKYDILGKIGEGSFATVYMARDVTLDRIVALKVLRRELLSDALFVERFEAEARLAARLEHPNAVRVYEVDAVEGTRFLAMEYVEGQSLAELLRVRGRLLPGDALRVVHGVASALDAAHARGLVHRDIKPSNILIRKDGQVMLSDFGLARAVDSSVVASMSAGRMLIGTLRYMSPEQAEQKQAERRSDVYSLGVVLYEMLTGQPPFQGETAIQLIRAHADLKPPRPRTIHAAIPPAVESVVRRALSKAPANRFDSAGALARALEAAVKQGVAVAVPEDEPPRRREPPPSTPAPAGRRWALALGAAAAVLILVLAGVLAVRGLLQRIAVQETPPPGPVAAGTALAPEATAEELPAATGTAPSPAPSDSATPRPSDAPLPTPTLSATPSATLPPQPSASAPAVDLAGRQPVGSAFEANGISLTLADYHIQADGAIELAFLVGNSGNSRVLLRWQNSYFSVIDDTGKAYPQDQNNLLDSKQKELAPGESFDIRGDPWPDQFAEIGVFRAKVPEAASYLFVEVSQFGELRDLGWYIRLSPILSSPQAPSPGSQQPLLEGFAANGISLQLAEYSISPEGEIWLKFLVQNSGQHNVLLRYTNKAFSVRDDTGTLYEQTQDNLLDPKQVLLEPGGSYDIRSDRWPDAYDEVGMFVGRVPEAATALVVRVSQFADLREMEWRLPIAAQRPTTQSPPPGTQLPPLEGFSGSGLAVVLAEWSIETDGRIWLKFVVRNEGNARVLLRYRNKYWSVQDDLGNAYPQTQDNLLDPKQVLLDPGDTVDIRGDQWPDGYNEIGMFSGRVPEGASALVVKIAQFADLRDMQWLIPLNAQLQSPQTPAPGTQLPPLEGFSANGIELLLAEWSIEPDGQIWLNFVVRNEGNNAVLLRYQNRYWSVKDDRGNDYPQTQDNLLDPKQVLLKPGDTYNLRGDRWPDGHDEIGMFVGQVPEEASALIVKVAQFSGLRDLQWRIPLR